MLQSTYFVNWPIILNVQMIWIPLSLGNSELHFTIRSDLIGNFILPIGLKFGVYDVKLTFTLINQYVSRLRAYPQIDRCGIMDPKGGGKNGEKKLQVVDNIRRILGGNKGRDTRTSAVSGENI